MSAATAATLALYLVLGGALGAAYFALLRLTVARFASNAGATRIVPLYAVRLVGAAVAFWAVAQQGALPLLAAFLGFLGARLAVQRWPWR